MIASFGAIAAGAGDKTSSTYVVENTIVDEGYLRYCLRQQIIIDQATTKIADKDALITTESVEAAKLHQQVNHLVASQSTSPSHQAQYRHFLTQREKQRNLVLGLLEDRHRIYKRTMRLRGEFVEFCKGMYFKPADIKEVCADSELSNAYSCQLMF